MLAAIRDKNVYLVYLVIFLLGTAYGASLSVTPLELKHLAFDETDIGTLAICFASGIVLMSIPAGALVRRFSAKITLIVCLLAYAVAVFAFPLQHTYAGVGVVRALDGAASVGVWVACETVLLARSDKTHKAFVMSLYAMSIALGYAAGSGVARVIALFATYREVFFFAAALAALTSLVVVLWVDRDAHVPGAGAASGRPHSGVASQREEGLAPTRRPSAYETASQFHRSEPSAPASASASGRTHLGVADATYGSAPLLRDGLRPTFGYAESRSEPSAPASASASASAPAPLPALSLLFRIKTSCLATFSYGYFQASVVLFLPLYLVAKKNVPEKDTILITLFFAGGMLLFSNPIARVGDRVGHLRTMTVLASIGTLMILGFVYLSSWPLMCAAIFVAGASLASISPVSLALQGHICEPRDYSRANGIYNACYAAGMLLGPPISSVIMKKSGGPAMLYHFAAMWVLFVALSIAFRKDDPHARGGANVTS